MAGGRGAHVSRVRGPRRAPRRGVLGVWGAFWGFGGCFEVLRPRVSSSGRPPANMHAGLVVVQGPGPPSGPPRRPPARPRSICANIGAGVLSLPNAVAWLGYVAGPIMIVFCTSVAMMCAEVRSTRARGPPWRGRGGLSPSPSHSHAHANCQGAAKARCQNTVPLYHTRTLPSFPGPKRAPHADPRSPFLPTHSGHAPDADSHTPPLLPHTLAQTRARC